MTAKMVIGNKSIPLMKVSPRESVKVKIEFMREIFDDPEYKDFSIKFSKEEIELAEREA